MRRRLVFLSLCVGSLVIAQACGGTTDSDDGGIDSSANDVTTNPDVNNNPDTGGPDVIDNDVTPGDGGTDASSGDASDGATTQDGGKPITSWTCGNTTVSDCAQCTGHTQTCVYCSNADASVVSGVCVQFGTGCGNTTPQGYNLCSCPKDASTCPEPYLVCLQVTQQQSVCDTCGAVNTTNGLTCENGGKCVADSGACQ
jgi:hypothetical protein